MLTELWYPNSIIPYP
ncbi:unnamed protein product, partial [Rotaria socialis]